MERLKTPSDAQLMQIAINDLNDSSLTLEDHCHALQELLILVEPIDNSNGFQIAAQSWPAAFCHPETPTDTISDGMIFCYMTGTANVFTDWDDSSL
ncbi:hypothetical protein U1Q18_034543 [Sarracenia purpurea var. burkii]